MSGVNQLGWVVVEPDDRGGVARVVPGTRVLGPGVERHANRPAGTWHRLTPVGRGSRAARATGVASDGRGR